MQHKPKPGHNKTHGFTTTSGISEDIQVNILDRLPKDRILVALNRLKTIVQTVPLSGFDDTTVGDKDTQCTWGFCSDNKNLWPRAKDHDFPYDFLNEGRITPLTYHGECPMQMEKGNGSGCFWYCKFFSREYNNPTREEMLELIDKRIKEITDG